MKKNLTKIIAAFIAAFLVMVSGCGVKEEKEAVSGAYIQDKAQEDVPAAAEEITPTATLAPEIENEAEKTPQPTERAVLPAPAATPEIETGADANNEFTCTLSVKCDTILKNMHRLKAGKEEIIPQSGIIYKEKTVIFSDGESVFDVLLREMKENKIHLEFSKTPIYNSTYIEGIGNIYEFDCGELSGWMYKVNGKIADCDSSGYLLRNGDVIEWVYTCNMGKDIGK